MKVLLVIAEGQLYLVAVLAIFLAELWLLVWGLWTRRPLVGLLAVFAMVPLLRTTIAAIRACFFRVEPPEGLTLDRDAGRALFDVVDDVVRAIGAPAVNTIIVTGEFQASAVVYRPAWRPWRRRVLVLGFPVMATLSTDELRAVIAHELAHFSSAHDAFAAWVYRTRRSWLGVHASLDRRRATPLYVFWITRWYVPRLHVASAAVARRHEFMADTAAAAVAGSRTVADALVAFEAGARFADEIHWPALENVNDASPEIPRPYSAMLTWQPRTPSPDVLADLVAGKSGEWDSHPSLGERLASLGEPHRVPPPVAAPAGEQILGAVFSTLADRLDRQWAATTGESWAQARAVERERHAALERMAAIESPTIQQLCEHADLLDSLERGDEALPIYERAAALGHAGASLAAGRIRLERGDEAGIPLVEAAMQRDASLIPDGCGVLARYYRDVNQELAARECEHRATKYTTERRLAEGLNSRPA